MTIKTRPKVFETNSSATHSLTINFSYRDDHYEILKLNRKGLLVFKGGLFERENADYSDAKTKANYCAVFCRLKSICEGNSDYTERFERVLEARTKAKGIIYDFAVSDEEPPNKNLGSINHQSENAARDAFTNDRALTKFIFDPQSWLHITADG